jgi:transposase
MPKILRARAPQDEKEARWIRRLAASRRGPADWILHAKIIIKSWDGKRVEAIAGELNCSQQTVRRRLHRFEMEGIDGLGDRPRSGRPCRLTETERSKLIALVRETPPGRLERQADELVARDEEGSAQWSLDALAQAAKEAGIAVKRSQIRRILLREGVRWRRTHSWGKSDDPDFVPKERRSSPTTRSRPRGRRPCAPMNLDQ